MFKMWIQSELSCFAFSDCDKHWGEFVASISRYNRHRGTSGQDSRPGGRHHRGRCSLACSSWLAQHTFLQNPGPPIQVTPPFISINKKMPYWYFWRLFVSFCFCFFCCLFVLLVFSIFDFCFCGVLLYVCFLNLFVSCFFCFSFLGEKNRERKHKVGWIGSGEDLGKLRERKTWSKYILWKYF